MTAPPAGALEACLALLVEQMDMLHDDFVSYSDGKPTVPFVVLRDSLVAALNAYDEARPALLAALRLREGCEGLEEKWREVATDDDRKARGRGNNQWFRSSANANRICADDLARVLEEGE